ncbi:SCO family protein [Burkholderiales bacterium]|nr:SCO family protein [Burkholderiales bacterium]
MLLLLMAVVTLLFGCDDRVNNQERFTNTDISGADFARDFELTSHHGERVSLSDFEGKVVILFFGFMRCPDICPTTLTELNGLMNTLGTDAKSVQVLFVTVDPERDNIESLGPYMQVFNPSFLGLWGSKDELEAVAKEFKIIYQKVAGSNPDNYSVDHSAGTYVFDKNGKVRLFVPYGSDADKLLSDVRLLIGAN